ncbi:head-tail connector protein [Stutzerimonas nitrititolerans]|uniref:head-tail connector protein n=1 Tax=Stutzerimonas nitrititolerans TaxID=2482751 RepID=UPI0028B16F98|nr:head-tail connector protein [Stutzerimonas nitrititolerans]
MPVIDMSIAREHLRDPEDDEAYLVALLSAAEDRAAHYLNRRFFGDVHEMEAAVANGTAGDRPIIINPSITAACLLILGHLYANREDVVTGTIATDLPMGSQALLTPYRVGWGI